MPIFVETLIRAPLDELWAATQEPSLHARWDLRFSDIDYLPKASDDAPQQFRYRTRIGFGLGIAGEGESVGERSLVDGSRTSALKFWSADAKSLIREGSGFWKYEPAGEAIRFFTVYDYRTRFGIAGRIVDRIVFRPVMAWATAWSFDRLRLWLEEGVRPADAMRLAIANAMAQASLAVIWIYQGLVPKLLVNDSGELALTIATIGAPHAHAALLAAGIGEIAIGAALLVFRRSRALLLASAAGVLALTIAGIVNTPSIAIAPFNAVTLTLGMLALTAISLATLGSAPTASRTRWSSWRKR
jgi:hypothetical protein